MSTVHAPEQGHTGPGAPGPQGRTELALPGLLLGGAAVVAAFGLFSLLLSALASTGDGGASYNRWLADIPGSASDRLAWVLGDMTEPQFYKSPVASVGLLLGAALAWWAGTRERRWAGFGISYGSGLWPWVVMSATLSLLLSNLAFGSQLDDGWAPTFVPFVAVGPAMVLIYGRGWAVAVTGAVLGAALTTPVAILLMNEVTVPLDLPVVVANTAAMSIAALVSFVLARRLPWMTVEAPQPGPTTETATEPSTIEGTPTVRKDAVWTVRRVVADFTETQFYANELASIGLLLGATVAVIASSDLPSYGTSLIPQIIFAQALTSTIGVLVWHRRYRAGGWAPTYVSLVSVAPATVLAYDGSALSIVVGAVAGALLCPLVAIPIASRLPADVHPFIGNTTAMAVVSAIVVPAAGQLPGI